MKMHKRPAFTLLEAIAILPLLTLFLGLLAWMTMAQLRITKAAAQQAHRQTTMQRVLATIRKDALTTQQLQVHALDVDSPDEMIDAIESWAMVEGLPPRGAGFQRSAISHVDLRTDDSVIEYYLLQDDEVPSVANGSVDLIADGDENEDAGGASTDENSDSPAQDSSKRSDDSANARTVTQTALHSTTKMTRQFLIRRSQEDPIPVRVWALHDLHLSLSEGLQDKSLLRIQFVGNYHADARVPTTNQYETTLFVQKGTP